MEALQSNEQPQNEGEYLQMVAHLKQLYDEIEMKNHLLELQKLDLKKVLITSYGLIRMIDNICDNIDGIPNDLITLIEVVRSYLSAEVDSHIFHIEQGSL
tara:strand:- start:2824 stop:3123 length:300 start_codon:yes stop_codon:yes gene_type:complete